MKSILSFLVMLVLASVLPAQTLNWDYHSILTDEQQSGANPDMAMGSTGDIHVSFWNSLTDRLMYARRNYSTRQWTISTVDIQRTAGYKSAIVLDANEKAHIAYTININGKTILGYATNQTGSWVTQTIADSIELGDYSPDNFPYYSFKPSIDIALQNTGKPFIACFDGSRTPSSADCVYGDTRDLNLFLAYQVGSAWQTSQTPNVISPTSITCVDRDRHGEFVQIIPANTGGGMYLFTNAYFGKKLLAFKSNGVNLSQWTTMPLDSASRLGVTTIDYETFDEISVAKIPGADNVFVGYGFSYAYGSAGGNGVNKGLFANISHELYGTPNYDAIYNTIETNASIKGLTVAPVSQNEVYLTYYSKNTATLICGKVISGGLQIFRDTIATAVFPGGAPLKSAIYNDTLYVLLHDGNTNTLKLAKKHTDDITNSTKAWKWETGTKTETRASYFEAALSKSGTNDVLHITFDEKGEDRIYYGSKTGAAAWTYLPVSETGKNSREVQMALNATNIPYIVYVEYETNLLKGARKSGNSWIEETISDIGETPREPDVFIEGNQIYVVYHDANGGSLRYATSTWASGTWTRTMLDNSNGLTGKSPNIAVDNSGNVHIVYLNAVRQRLEYRYKPNGGAWSYDSLTTSFLENPYAPRIELNSTGSPFIAYYARIEQTISLMEKINGSWTKTIPVDFSTSAEFGYPLTLRIDAQDRLWLLYDYHLFSAQDLRLARRYPDGTWNGVSVVNNQGEIGTSFDFHTTTSDLYILGKKNKVGDNGIAYMYAEEGLSVDIEREAILQTATIFPNPTHDILNFEGTFPENTPAKITLLDITGKIIYTCPLVLQPNGKTQAAWDAHALPNGLYFCRWEVGNIHFTQKWIKQ